MIRAALFSSTSDLWGTPPNLFRMLDQVYEFKLDAAASDASAFCDTYFTLQSDGLSRDWFPYRRVWLNPPYGRSIAQWMRKDYQEAQKGCLVICLVPARVDTKWWHDWVENKGQVTFLKGRLRYVRHTDENGARSGSAPFPSALVKYEPDLETRHHFSSAPVQRSARLSSACRADIVTAKRVGGVTRG